MFRRLERMGFLSSKQGDFLEADRRFRGPTWLSWHKVRGARFLSVGTNVNESSLQFYVTMPIWVI
jgi:hypothetical protein